MNLVLYTESGERLPCVDWPTAIIGLMCRDEPAHVEHLDAPCDKTHKVAQYVSITGSKKLYGWRDTPYANIRYLNGVELDRLMAGEDL